MGILQFPAFAQKDSVVIRKILREFDFENTSLFVEGFWESGAFLPGVPQISTQKQGAAIFSSNISNRVYHLTENDAVPANSIPARIMTLHLPLFKLAATKSLSRRNIDHSLFCIGQFHFQRSRAIIF